MDSGQAVLHAHLSGTLAQAGAEWSTRLARHPEAPECHRWTSGTLPQDRYKTLRRITENEATDTAPRPTIATSGDVSDALRPVLPELTMLCTDLEAPANHKRGRAAFSTRDPGGSYMHCGVRERLMGAMGDGIAAHGGLRPVNGTYLVFADYERAAMRMAALMGLTERKNHPMTRVSGSVRR